MQVGKITNITGKPFKEFSPVVTKRLTTLHTYIHTQFTYVNVICSGVPGSILPQPEEENPASIIYPRYETMCLQAVLAPRHVGWNRAMCLGGESEFGPPPSQIYMVSNVCMYVLSLLGKSLLEYRSTSGLDPSRYTTEVSVVHRYHTYTNNTYIYIHTYIHT